jgi:hypothetical protein
MTLFVEEFLYRGRAPSDAQPSAWHVILGDAVTDAFGKQSISLSDALTPSQAEELGFPLSAVIAGINNELAKQVDALSTELAATKGERDRAVTALDQMSKLQLAQGSDQSAPPSS